MRQSATVNLNRPKSDWKRVRPMYICVALPIALLAGYVSFQLCDNLFLQVLLAIVGCAITYFCGLLGGIIGAWFIYVFQPKSIRVYGSSDNNTRDLVNAKLQWVLFYPLSSVVCGCITPWIILGALSPEYGTLFVIRLAQVFTH